jgi:hypothetical protein
MLSQENSLLFLILLLCFSCKTEKKDFKKVTHKVSSSSEYKNLCVYLKNFNSDSLFIKFYRNYTIVEHSNKEGSLELKESYLNQFQKSIKNNYSFDISYINKEGNNIFVTSMDVGRDYTILNTKEFELIFLKKYSDYIFYNTNDALYENKPNNYIYKISDSLYFINNKR